MFNHTILIQLSLVQIVTQDCPGASEVEYFINMPRLDKFSDKDLLQFCIENKITHVLPTRDGELNFWAKRRDLLTNIGVTPVGLRGELYKVM